MHGRADTGWPQHAWEEMTFTGRAGAGTTRHHYLGLGGLAWQVLRISWLKLMVGVPVLPATTRNRMASPQTCPASPHPSRHFLAILVGGFEPYRRMKLTFDS